MKTTKSIEETMAAREDDAAELAKQQPDQADLASRIAAYLSDQLSASEMDALYRTNQKEIDAEIERRDRAAKQKKEQDVRKAKSLWVDDLATQADATAADAEIRKFLLAHPHFPRHVPQNGQALLRWLAENNLLCTLENLEKAYVFLRPQGVFVQKTEEEQVEARMSASEFKKMHASDWPEERAIPPLILQRIAQILETFAQANPRYIHSDSNKNKIVSALVKSGMQITTQSLQEIYNDLTSRGELELSNAAQTGEVLTVTNLGGHAPGYPARPQKYSFRKKIDEMTADEVKQRILDDPNFEAALNNLNP
jgi:hypothetical protein